MLRLRAVIVAVAVAALGVGFGAAATPAGAAKGAGAARAACARLRQGQAVDVRVRFHYLHTISYVNSAEQLVQHTFTDTHRRFADVRIGGASCKPPGRAWRVIDPIGVGYSSAGLSSDGDVVGSGLTKGWGVGIRGGAGGSAPRIQLQVMHCGRGVFWSVVRTLNEVPIPGLQYVVDVAKWAAGLFLPADRVRCADLGVKHLRVRADRNGRLRVHDGDPIGGAEVWTATSSGRTTRKGFYVEPVGVYRVR